MDSKENLTSEGTQDEIPVQSNDDPFVDEVSEENILEEDLQEVEVSSELSEDIGSYNEIPDMNDPDISSFDIGDTFIILVESKSSPFLSRITEISAQDNLIKMKDDSDRELSFLFDNGEIKHIHCISYDPYSDDIWVMTGDYEGQCKILVCDQSFNVKECLGDGGQDWRTCGVAFEKEFVYWGMDSPLKPSFIVKFSRSARTIEKIHPVDGPVWYIKSLSDGITLAGITVEPGASVQTKSAQIIATTDYKSWHIIAEFEKDKWSMKWFKYGVLCFADGNQSSESFAVFGEVLKNFDGISRLYTIDKDGLLYEAG